MSIGKALAQGVPVVLTAADGRVPEVICEPGKEKEALELLQTMGIITLTRPERNICALPKSKDRLL